MLATAVTLAVLWFAITMLDELYRLNRAKILAALQGRSWVSERSVPVRPVMVRFSPRFEAMSSMPPLRAAA